MNPTFKNFLWYALPFLIRNFIPLISLPFFTRYISPSDFGTLALSVIYGVFIVGLLNLGLIFISATIIYYFVISKMLAVGMIPFIIGIIVIFLWLENTDYPIISILIGLNMTRLYGLFRGRKQDNNFASLMNDVQMIIIGTLWMLSKLYKKIGIPK